MHFSGRVVAEENFSDCLSALLRGHFRARSYCRMAGGRVLTTARGHLVVLLFLTASFHAARGTPHGCGNGHHRNCW